MIDRLSEMYYKSN